MTTAVSAPLDLEPRKPSVPLWAVAALAAVLLHAAAIGLIVMHLQADDPEEALGAPALEIGLDLAAPHLAPTDLPPGPESEASAATPPVPEQKATAEESTLPKDTPTETDDPDRLVAPNASTKPKEDDPLIKTVETAPSAESVASEATAPPSSDTAREAPISTAPAQGTGASAALVRTTWQKELVGHLNKFKRYPTTGARRSVDIAVAFTLDRNGHMLAASIEKSSGDAAFDEAALDMLHRADPVPAPPPLVADEGLTFSLPVVFRVKDK